MGITKEIKMIVSIKNIGSEFTGVINAFEIISAEVIPFSKARITVNFGEVVNESLIVKDNREFDLTDEQYNEWGLDDAYLNQVVITKFGLVLE